MITSNRSREAAGFDADLDVPGNSRLGMAIPIVRWKGGA